MPCSRLVASVLALAMLAGACTGAASSPRIKAEEPADDVPPPPRARNTAPRLTAEVVLAASPGRTVSTVLPVDDHEGDRIRVEADGPVGLSVARRRDGTWSVRWSPRDTGSEVVSLALTDDRGGFREVEIVLRSTNRFGADTLIGLGDSVASGHGLQKRDYLGRDECWRSEREAYPWLVREGLVERGDLDPGGDYGLVACSGATIADLLDDPVSGGPPGVAPAGEDRMSQVDWMIAANPEIVTLTVGANTLGFTDPWNLVDGNSVDRDELERRRLRVEEDLDAVLRRLVEHTDSTVFITNYYNPAADDPQGIDGCDRACFRDRSEEVVEVFNASIAAVVADQPADRVVLVDIASVFVGHGAPNGLGPDGVRSGASGWLRDLVGAPLEGVHPYCAGGHDDDGSWINYVDCVHPDGRGHREIAAAILEAIG